MATLCHHTVDAETQHPLPNASEKAAGVYGGAE